MHECGHVLRRRQQARQVEREAADEGGGVGFGRGGKAFLLEAGENETVDRIGGPGCVLHWGRLNVGERQKGPVAFILGALLDPAAEDGNLLVGEVGLLAGRRRHVLVGVFGRDALDQRALVGFAGNDRRVAAEVGRGAFAIVEPKIGFAVLGIGAVAVEAVARKDRTDVLVEADLFGDGSGGGRRD